MTPEEAKTMVLLGKNPKKKTMGQHHPPAPGQEDAILGPRVICTIALFGSDAHLDWVFVT